MTFKNSIRIAGPVDKQKGLITLQKSNAIKKYNK